MCLKLCGVKESYNRVLERVWENLELKEVQISSLRRRKECYERTGGAEMLPFTINSGAFYRCGNCT